MSKIRIVACVTAAFIAIPAAAAPRPTGEEQLQKMIAGRAADKPQDCLSRSPTMDSTNVEGVGVVYRNGGTLYVNRFQNGCPMLTSSRSIITRTPSNLLCRGDIARIIDLVSGIEGGSCIYGDFTPYRKTK